MRKMIALLLCLTLLPLMPVVAEGVLTVEAPAETVRPGKAVTIAFDAPVAGPVTIEVLDDQEQLVSVVVTDYPAWAGRNELVWNGTWQGVPTPAGSYTLTVRMNGEAASAPIHVGDIAPYLYGLELVNGYVTPGVPLEVNAHASVDGVITWGMLAEDTWTILSSMSVFAGPATVVWDGLVNGQPLDDGDYIFTVTLTDHSGFDSTEEHLPMTVAGFAPVAEEDINPDDLPEEEEEADEEEFFDELPDLEDVNPDDLPEEYDEDMNPDDLPEEYDEEMNPDDMPEEEEDEGFDEEELADLEDEEEAPATMTDLPAEAAEKVYTPSYGSPYADTSAEPTYWNTPMDINDVERIWAMIQSPMTVVDNGKKNAEKTQVILREEPDEDSLGVGVVTCITQGVRVLEKLDNGWSLIECYSSSFHDNTVTPWNMLVQGYVQTKMLKTVQPSTERGIVIDKLTQRMYIFEEGKLLSTLLVSTGLANERQPYNETRSGEFLLTSAVGEFKSDNLACSMAIRFNDGDLLHEVPHVKQKDGGKNYKSCEPKLGTKASHGCIRVQRKRTPEGINMTWLWNNRIKNTRLIIWEDWQGRQMEIPADDLVLYYNAKNGELYHSQATCYSVTRQGVEFTPFTYAELDNEPYAKLERCDYCAPVLRRGEIEAINAIYAEGGDHDPVMTEARAEWFEELEERRAEKAEK